MPKRILRRVSTITLVIPALGITGLGSYISLEYAWDVDHREHVNKYVFFILCAIMMTGIVYAIFKSRQER